MQPAGLAVALVLGEGLELGEQLAGEGVVAQVYIFNVYRIEFRK